MKAPMLTLFFAVAVGFCVYAPIASAWTRHP